MNMENEAQEVKTKKKSVGRIVRGALKYIVPMMIIVVGACVMMMPWTDAHRYDKLQSQALDAWEKAIATGELATGARRDSPGGRWDAAAAAVGDYITPDGVWHEDTDPDFSVSYLLGAMQAVLVIDKISLRSPILASPTKHNLDIAPCSAVPSRSPGTGNFVVAGHFSRIRGRHFSRLKELAPGDLVSVDTGIQRFDYAVTDLFSVGPDETWVMADSDDLSLITLITCDYDFFPYRRFIVTAALVD